MMLQYEIDSVSACKALCIDFPSLSMAIVKEKEPEFVTFYDLKTGVWKETCLIPGSDFICLTMSSKLQSLVAVDQKSQQVKVYQISRSAF